MLEHLLHDLSPFIGEFDIFLDKST